MQETSDQPCMSEVLVLIRTSMSGTLPSEIPKILLLNELANVGRKTPALGSVPVPKARDSQEFC